jgi:N-acyl homoserine lactone hydrolase
MKIVEFDGRGQKIETDGGALGASRASHLAPRPNLSVGRGAGRCVRSDVQLYMFQIGTLPTKTKDIKMDQGDGDFEIPAPWYLIKHLKGIVVIDGGNGVEAALDKRGQWGAAVDAYDPVMDARDNCVDQCRSVGVRPEDVR